jgi:GH25 family lysozyme M1 (1,4-beta-N-acetylmuramidase)
MAGPIAIDLSHHNRVNSWPAIKSAGVRAVILKATEGTSYVDNTFADRRLDAIRAGLIVSSYHFLKHGDVDAQMQHYLETVNPKRGERVVIDHEDAAVTLDDLHEAVEAILNADPSLQITVYSGHTIKEQLGDKRDDHLAEHTSLWIAQYTSAAAPSWPKATWPAWSLWQYTDRASVPGVSGPCDANRFNGSDEAALRWLAPAEPVAPQAPSEPIPIPKPEPQAVTVNISTPPGVPVAVVVNGEIIANTGGPS